MVEEEEEERGGEEGVGMPLAAWFTEPFPEAAPATRARTPADKFLFSPVVTPLTALGGGSIEEEEEEEEEGGI